MGKATRAALAAFAGSELDKKRKEKMFNDKYYVDIASGEVKERLYNDKRVKKVYPPKQEVEE